MVFRRLLPLIVVASLGPVAFGCAETAPYVYNAIEFDRDAEGFGKQPANINKVEICYSKHSTTAQALRELASARCGEFGKVARYQTQVDWECPLFTPVRAVFACVKE